ncbi:MAG: hypothetical protein RL264_2219 [Bacteroidota bacterium]|jgi:hypothetical protein
MRGDHRKAIRVGINLKTMENNSNHKLMKRGAIASPRHLLAAASPHQLLGNTPPQFLYLPAQLSNWGNDQYGDCVSAEEAFNKACNNPEIFIPRDLVIDWATQNGYLNGAVLVNVLQTMQNNGFVLDGTTYNDGPYSSVNWHDNLLLQNAISNLGTVKLGVAAEDFGFWTGKNGWFATGLPSGKQEDHCVSLCGYGTFQWLANQLNVQVPSGIDPNQMGYAMFTWGTIGIIDIPSLLNITYEAWVRNPTNTSAPTSFFRLWNGTEHFYTVSLSERDNAIANLGYQNEGVACNVYRINIAGTNPFYRLWNGTDHFYTTSESERDNAIANCGYQSEGIACYVYLSQIVGTIPLFRLWNGTDHFYTTSSSERDNATTNLGYQSEGIACYVLPS